jgi:hypothetical protein
MCTQIRTLASSMRSAEIASSKSRALTGSIVNVGRSRRSRRPAWTAPVSRRARLALDGGVEGAPQSAIEHQRLDHVAGHVGPAQHGGEPQLPAASLAPGRRPFQQHEIAVPGRPVRATSVAATAATGAPVERHAPAALEERAGGEEATAALDQAHDA